MSKVYKIDLAAEIPLVCVGQCGREPTWGAILLRIGRNPRKPDVSMVAVCDQ